VKPYPLVDDLVGPVLRVGMPRAARSMALRARVQLVARWRIQRAVGSPSLMAPYVPRWGRRRMGIMPSHNQGVGA
jgi:hypothetical protein